MTHETRIAEPPDAVEIASVHVRSWQRAYRGLLPDAYLDALRPEDRAARYTFGGDAPTTIVATDGEAIRGFATFAAGELLALYVDPDHWGSGIGRRLTREVRARLRARGFDAIVAWVLAGNEVGERFYRADGWVPDGTRRRSEVAGVMTDQLRYRCSAR